jgi:PAS domain S-box-containing protein
MNHPLRILFIEDDPDDRLLVIEELRREFSELEVTVITDAPSWAQALEASDFDLVITDYALGWTDGLTILKTVKARWPNRPVIMFTGTGSEEIAVEAMKAGLDDYILKSFQRSARLPAAVRSALKRVQDRRVMREAQNRYLSLFDGVPVGLYRSTPQGQFLIANPALAQMLGYPDRESFLMASAADLYVDPEVRQEWQALLEQEGTVHDFEERFRRYDGTVIWVRDTARAVRDAAGQVQYYEGSLEDITDRKRAQEALAHRAREMAALYETSLAINSQLDLSTLLEAIVQRAAELVGTGRGVLYLMQPDGETLELTVSRNQPDDYVGTIIRLGEGLSGRVAQTGEPMMVTDYQNWEGRVPAYENAPKGRILGVPIKRGGKVIGVINVADNEQMGSFSDEEVRLVSLFAEQAAVAIENARLFEAEREQRELAEALRETGSVLSATLDLDTVLDRLLDQIARLVPYDATCIMLVEGEHISIVRLRGYDQFGEQIARSVAELSLDIAATANLRRMTETQQPLIVPDTAVEPDWVKVEASAHLRSWAGAPIVVQGQVVAFFSLEKVEPGFYGPEHARRLAAFAGQAALALQNAWLFEAEARRRREAETLQVATQALSTSLDLQQVFELILSELKKVVPYDSASVQQLKDSRLQIIGGDGFPNLEDLLGECFDLRTDQNPNQEVVRRRAPFILDDAPTVYNGFRRQPHAQVRTRSWLGVPLLFGDQLIGMIALDKREPGFYSQEHARLAMAFAAQAAIAIENARLFDAAQQEIAERKQATHALRESEERFRRMADNIQDGLTIIEHGKTVYMNDRVCEILGYSKDRLGEMTVLDFAAPEEKVRLKGIMEEARRSAVFPAELVFWIVRQDGSRRCIHNRYSSNLREGKIVGQYVITSDITERKRLEEELLQAQKMEAVGRLAGGVAHDFNNLLTAIRGYTDLLLTDLRDGDPVRVDVKEIDRAAERAASLTRQLLAFSRRQVLQPTVMDLNVTVANMERMLSRLIGEDIDLIAKFAPDQALVRADAGQIEQVIMNLVVNARDAMPHGGKLTIETAKVELDDDYSRRHVGAEPGSYVLLAVSDTGVGMDQEAQSHLFEPFFTTKELGKGTGLGLSTVYGIVKQSGGDIWVYSEPEHGTTFKIYLPSVHDAVEVDLVSSRAIESFEGMETILLVEDETLVRGLARRVLERKGYRVLTAHNADGALLICEQHEGPIHLMVTDVVMPGGASGCELAKLLTSLRPEAKVLYISGYTADAIVHHGVLEPDIAFLQKPFTPDVLARKVREVIDTP